MRSDDAPQDQDEQHAGDEEQTGEDRDTELRAAGFAGGCMILRFAINKLCGLLLARKETV